MTDNLQPGDVEERIAAQDNRKLAAFTLEVLKQKRRILLCALTLAVLTALLSLIVKPYFSATIEVIPPSTKVASSLSIFSAAGGISDPFGYGGFGSALQTKAQGDAFMEMLSAWQVQDAVVKRFNLTDIYKVPTVRSARSQLSADTVMEGAKGYVTIKFTAPNAQLAAAVANGYIDEVRLFMRGMALTEATQRRAFYEQQLAKVKDDLTQAETDFKTMQQSSRIIAVDAQARQLIEEAASLRSRITAREVELQRMRSYSTDSNPQVQILQTELSALRGQLNQIDSKQGQGFSGGNLSSVPENELTFIRATRELKYQEALYELLMRQYEASRLDEARDAPIVQVINPAQVPVIRSGPHRTYATLEAFAYGAFLGLMWVVYRVWRAGLSLAGAARMTQIRKAVFSW